MTPLRTIAVGFDGSPDAEAAARWAFDLARGVGAEVVIVACGGPSRTRCPPGGHGRVRDDLRDLIREAELDPDRVRWHSSDGDPCSVLLRVMDAPSQRTWWWWVRADRDLTQGTSWGVPATNSPSTPSSRWSSCHGKVEAPNTEPAQRRRSAQGRCSRKAQ